MSGDLFSDVYFCRDWRRAMLAQPSSLGKVVSVEEPTPVRADQSGSAEVTVRLEGESWRYSAAYQGGGHDPNCRGLEGVFVPFLSRSTRLPLTRMV